METFNSIPSAVDPFEDSGETATGSRADTYYDTASQAEPTLQQQEVIARLDNGEISEDDALRLLDIIASKTVL